MEKRNFILEKRKRKRAFAVHAGNNSAPSQKKYQLIQPLRWSVG